MANVVTGASEYLQKRTSCPTHMPMRMFRSVFASLRRSACMMGLQTTPPSPPLAGGSRSRSALRLLSSLQPTVSTQNPACSSSLARMRVSRSMMVHDAMPMWVAPMRFANLMVSCTRVEFAVSSLTIAAACMMTWFSGSAYRRCASSCSADETAPCAQNPGSSRSVYSHAVVPQLMQLSFDSMIPPDWVSRVADMTSISYDPARRNGAMGS